MWRELTRILELPAQKLGEKLGADYSGVHSPNVPSPPSKFNPDPKNGSTPPLSTFTPLLQVPYRWKWIPMLKMTAHESFFRGP